MSVTQLIGSLAEYESAVAHLRLVDQTHIKLYRGQGDDWELLPALFRRYRKQVEVIHGKEQESLTRLKRRIPWRTPMRPENDWDWLSFGQHYGLLTRMLDWSESHLIALFFAVEKTPVKPTVYVYHAQDKQVLGGQDKKLAPAKITLTHIMKPKVHSVRVVLQKGWHTVHHLHPRKSGGKMVIPLADMEWHKGRMRTIKIDPARWEAIRGELAKQGIHRATVYGEFERVCGSICSECFS